MRQRDAEAASRHDREQRERSALWLREEQAWTEREARRAERQRLQEALRKATKGVSDAKEGLKAKRWDADKGREGRRRVADQLNYVLGKESENEALKAKSLKTDKVREERKRAADRINLAHGEENENVPDEACGESVRVEME